MSVLAIVPARTGSKGIPNKNFRDLRGITPTWRAIRCGWEAGCHVIVSSDRDPYFYDVTWLAAGPPLHTDTCPMIDVVEDVLARVPGPPDQQIVLIQPTQPLRQPKHITEALALLTPEVDSVVSVVELPRTHHPRQVMVQRTSGPTRYRGLLEQWSNVWRPEIPWDLEFPATRQELEPVYIRDGTVYAFWRKTVDTHGTLYGSTVKPLIIPAAETCPLDTLEDWAEAERRLSHE